MKVAAGRFRGCTAIMRAPTGPPAYQDGPIAYTIDGSASGHPFASVAAVHYRNVENCARAVTAIPSTTEML